MNEKLEIIVFVEKKHQHENKTSDRTIFNGIKIEVRTRARAHGRSFKRTRISAASMNDLYKMKLKWNKAQNKKKIQIN